MKRVCAFIFIVSGLSACSSVYYHPDQVTYVDVEKMSPKPEDVWIDVEEGVRLHAWLLAPPGPARGLIVHFHGNAQNLTSHWAFLRSAPEHGFAHLIFDYRGYGRSTGKPSPAGLVADGKAVLRYASARGLPLFVFAQSLGGAVAMRTLIELRGEVPVRRLIVDSSFASYRSEARRVMAGHALTWLLQPIAWLIVDNSAAPGSRVREIAPIPMLVVHGENDHVVPFALGEKVFDSAGEPKEFWRVPLGVHTDFMFRKSYRDRLWALLAADLK